MLEHRDSQCYMIDSKDPIDPMSNLEKFQFGWEVLGELMHIIAKFWKVWLPMLEHLLLPWLMGYHKSSLNIMHGLREFVSILDGLEEFWKSIWLIREALVIEFYCRPKSPMLVSFGWPMGVV